MFVSWTAEDGDRVPVADRELVADIRTIISESSIPSYRVQRWGRKTVSLRGTIRGCILPVGGPRVKQGID